MPPANSFKDKLFNLLTGARLLRPIFTFLRELFPIFVVGKNATVIRHAYVTNSFDGGRRFAR